MAGFKQIKIFTDTNIAHTLQSHLLVSSAVSEVISEHKEIEKTNQKMQLQELLNKWGGKEGYIKKWREDPRNINVEASDDEIIKFAEKQHPDLFL